MSLRQIRLEASAANNSAISYHFSDREKLVGAIWEHRLPMLEKMRRRMLDDLHARNLQQDAKSILRVLVMPNCDLRDGDGVHRYAAFFRHVLRWRPGGAIRRAELRATPASSEALALYHALRPDIPYALMNHRLRYGSCLFFDMLCDRDMDVSVGLSVMAEDAFLAEAIDMLDAICMRPVIA